MSRPKQLLRIGARLFPVAAEERVGIGFQRAALGRDRALAFTQAAVPGGRSESFHGSCSFRVLHVLQLASVSARRVEPFDGGDDALGEAAGEGHREISGAGRDRPADGEGGPPSDHKIIPPADIEERQRPAYDRNDDGGDHDRKDESCLAVHGLSEPLRLGTRPQSKLPRQLYRLPLSGVDHVDRAAVPTVFDGKSYDTADTYEPKPKINVTAEIFKDPL